MIRVILVDADVFVRIRTRRILESGGEIRVVAEAGDAAEAVAAMHQASPDVLLMCLDAPGVREIAEETDRRGPLTRLPSVLLVPRGPQRNAANLRRLDALGLVAAESAATEVTRAVRAAAAGNRFVSPALLPFLQAAPTEPEPVTLPPDPLTLLSAREREVLDLFAQSLAPKEIAAHLHLSAG